MFDLSHPPLLIPKPAIIRPATKELLQYGNPELANFLPGTFPAAAVMAQQTPKKLIDIFTFLGLTANLKLCLDAGDADSYTSGQPWLDRSGGGYDFNRGSTSSAEASDPTHNGTPGGLSSSEYWSFDGGDWFVYDTTNETWMQNLHKNNAIFTILMWGYFPTPVDNQAIVCTGGNATANVGLQWRLNSTNGGMTLSILNTTGGQALAVASTATVSANTWTMVGVSVDEAAAAGRFVINTTQETFNSTYSSPSASNAFQNMMLGAATTSQRIFPSGNRMAGLAIWEGGAALSGAEISAILGMTGYASTFRL